MEKKTLAFTGLRPQKLPFEFEEESLAYIALKKFLKEQIVELIEKENLCRFISGMALGVDQLCAEIILELKKEYQEITLEAALPCPEQDKIWKQSCREKYRAILEKCDVIYVVSDVYTHYCMHVRNRYMVDKCDIVLAVWDEKPGGTASTVKYAMKLGKEVIAVDPYKFLG